MTSKPLINTMKFMKKREASLDNYSKQKTQAHNEGLRLPYLQQAGRIMNNGIQINQSLVRYHQ
jgi:hypothetical protein